MGIWLNLQTHVSLMSKQSLGIKTNEINPNDALTQTEKLNIFHV